MKCEIIDNIYEYDYIEFIKNQIIQKDIDMKSIYKNINNMDYMYIICKENDKCLGVLPFILYRNKLANVINSLPFLGYGGISVCDERRDEAFKCIVNYIFDYAEKNNVSLVTICTEPFEENIDLYKKYFRYNYIKSNFYQYIDLKKDIFKAMKTKFRGNLKRNIKKCIEKYGVNVIESYKIEDLIFWYKNIYLKRLRETNCRIYPMEVFTGLLENKKKNRIKIFYGIINGEIIGGAIYLKQKKSVDNFMRVVKTEYLKTQLGTYLDYLSINYAIENNVEFYNWQSCDELGSSIFKYKEEWGSSLGYHHYITKEIKDITELKELPLEVINEEFKGIYVLPYEELSN